ncbi:aminoglycoside 6-adenylyltransferase [Spirosoma terrae]|uniref:Nucleotidyltransferase domain-containing protein n=1 Tax=Spirosoma terrae TaxID=1968276 RepID=A0A6L9L556_9BACT|nr:nucleotidyltransferase domain-containing protein [Spirosoma terrae]NDU94512.1 nucleotidyltransferase domain-containing protein [Spirosoma terrae]
MQTILQPFQTFIDRVVECLREDPGAIGLAVGGSWISADMDAYSDLDLVLVTEQAIAPDVAHMRAYASRLGTLIGAFRGDHVGEPRLLIALYDCPLLHVDIKFLTLPEFYERVEDPVVVWERNGLLTSVIQDSMAEYPPFDFQWIEDRFWIWVHYAALKIGRGEYFEAMDFLSFLRNVVFGPMVHLRKGGLPRGVRRLETLADQTDLIRLRNTVAAPERESLRKAMTEAIAFYEELRDILAPATLQKNDAAQTAVLRYVATL